MKNLLSIIVATWAVAVMSGAAGTAPTQAPAAEEDCMTLAYGMMECMGFLAEGGSETTPQGTCCSGLKSLIGVNADCMCYALTAAADMGINLDMSKAMSLPSLCAVATPSLSTCMQASSPSESAPSLPPSLAIGEPSAAPAPAPASSSSSSVVPAVFFNFFLFVVFAFFVVCAF